MDFFGKVGEKISEKGKVAADKAKDLTEIAKLKSQIVTCEDIIRRNYIEIGKEYFEEYADTPDAPFEKQCQAIKNAKAGIADLEKKINFIKGI